MVRGLRKTEVEKKTFEMSSMGEKTFEKFLCRKVCYKKWGLRGLL